MFSVFFEVVLPVALVAIAGAIIGRWRGVPVAPISSIVFYLFTPALVFYSMARTELSAEVSLRIVGVILVTYAVMYVVSTAWSLARRHGAPLRAAFALAVVTANGGNMGLPVAELAFGDKGLQVAVLVFVTGALLANSAGISVASMAGGSRREALIAPLRYPSLYAAGLGVLVNVFTIDLPITIEAPVESLAGAAVPAMLIVLGLQLQHAGGREHLVDAVAANFGKLAISPAIAWLAASAIGLEDINRGTLVVLSAMPTAVIAIILATEFKAYPAFLTRAVVTSTIASMLTLTVLITLVQ